jgi:hypothetical protein
MIGSTSAAGRHRDRRRRRIGQAYAEALAAAGTAVVVADIARTRRGSSRSARRRLDRR